MLQQNSYFPSRYCQWLKDNAVSAFVIPGILAIGFALLIVFLPLFAFLFSLPLLPVRFTAAINTQKKSSKKLVFTARIKRLYVSTSLLYAVLILLALCFDDYNAIFFCLLSFLSLVTPLTVLFCRMITTPLENAIAQWYVNDAKRILKSRPDLLIIGVTGSFGKTSTKFILSRLLSEKYNVLATPGSYNTPMGVVRTVREKLLPQTQVFICEMGAKNVGDIKEICDIVHPKFGIITSVGAQHLDTFQSVDNVFQTKFELADEVLKNGGEIFVNGDSEALLSRIDPGRYTVYGTDESFDFVIKEICSGPHGSAFKLETGSAPLALKTRLLGAHNIVNLAGAAALACRLGVGEKEIAYAASSLKPTEHRLELKSYLKGSVMIDDAYNANPEGSLEAIRILSSFEDMKKVIITPGLIELGDKEYDCNYRLGEAAGKSCDYIILVGKNRSKPLAEGVLSTGFSNEKLSVVSGFKEAVQVFSGFADAKTVVLVENDLPDNYLF